MDSPNWLVHPIESGGRDIDLVLARSTPAGFSCGWTNFAGGWTAWIAEQTTLLELRRTLSAPVSADDAEIMRLAIDRWGFHALERTNSVWAGVIWWKERKELFFFRDRLGVVPAFSSKYRLRDVEFNVLSTSMALIHRLCPRAREIKLSRLHSFLLHESDSCRDDFFKTVSRLHPGEYWRWGANGLQVGQYWQPNCRPRRQHGTPERTAATLVERLADITTGYLQLGFSPLTTVSGGLDSTLILSLQVEQARLMGLGSKCVKAVTMGFPSFPSADERRWTQELQEFLEHPISSICVERHWPMRAPEIFVRHAELGPSFHPGECYENCFIENAFAGHNERSVFWGLGADHLFVTSDNLMLGSLLKDRSISYRHRVAEAVRRFGVKHFAKYSIQSSSMAVPIQEIRNRWSFSERETVFPWRKPDRWVANANMVDESVFNSTKVAGPRSFLPLWNWELITRGFRKKNYELGISNHFPYLRSDFVELMFGVKAHWLSHNRGSRKDLLREMSRGYLPDSIRNRPKGGLFSKFAEYGLGSCEHSHIECLFRRESALADYGLIEPRAFLDVFSKYRAYSWAHQDRPEIAGEMLLWRTIAAELWCRKLG